MSDLTRPLAADAFRLHGREHPPADHRALRKHEIPSGPPVRSCVPIFFGHAKFRSVTDVLVNRLGLKVTSLFWVPLLIAVTACSGPEEYDRSYSWSPVSINAGIEGSAEVEAIIAPYRNRMDSMMDEVIGHAAHDLTTQGKYESTLGTFVTELLLRQSMSSFNRKVDVAIMNHHGGLRAPINQGPITLGEVFEVMPFENEVVLLDVPGEHLKEVIGRIARSGNSMIWPVSFHITQSGPENIRVNGEELVAVRNYSLAVSDYLANGGAGFDLLTSLERPDVHPVKLRDMIVREVRQKWADHDSIKAEVANHITQSDPDP